MIPSFEFCASIYVVAILDLKLSTQPLPYCNIKYNHDELKKWIFLHNHCYIVTTPSEKEQLQQIIAFLYNHCYITTGAKEIARICKFHISTQPLFYRNSCDHFLPCMRILLPTQPLFYRNNGGGATPIFQTKLPTQPLFYRNQEF